jgi:hypothetical protein
MTRERPWWASDGPLDGGLDTSEDPVERFRSARRGATEGGSTPGDGPVGDAGDLPFTDEPTSGRPGGAGVGAEGSPGTGDPVGGGAGQGRDLPPAGPWWEAAAETVSRLARDLAETAEAHGPPAGGHPDPAGEPTDAGDVGDAHPDIAGDGGTAGGSADAGTGGDGARDGARGHEGTGGTDEASAAGDGAARGAPGGTAHGASGDGEHRIDACGICPICVGIRALGESRPELVGHLAEAARHVALAARSLAARPSPGPRGDEPLQHIGLDE